MCVCVCVCVCVRSHISPGVSHDITERFCNIVSYFGNFKLLSRHVYTVCVHRRGYVNTPGFERKLVFMRHICNKIINLQVTY